MSNLIINGSDILLSILFNLLPASITILLCFFFLFLVAFNNFFTSPVHNENARRRLALAVPTSLPITVVNDAIETMPRVTDKIIKVLSK